MNPCLPAPSPPPPNGGHCSCEHHAVIWNVNTKNTPCKWAERPILHETSKPIPVPNIPTLQPVSTNLEFKLLFEEDGWMIEAHPDEDDTMLKLSDSWVTHYCPSMHWKVFMDVGYMTTYGVCHHCYQDIPAGVIALWQMHNWEYLQKMEMAPDYPPILGEDGLASAYATMQEANGS